MNGFDYLTMAAHPHQMRMQNSHDIAEARKRAGEINVARYQAVPETARAAEDR